jgi:hypothetical protein
MSAIFAPNPARRAAAIASAVFTWCAVSAAQACDLTLETPEAIRIEYNPFAIGPSSGPLDIGLRNGSDTPCDLRLRLVDDFDAPLAGVVLGGVGVEFRPREASGLLQRDAEPGTFLLNVPGAGEIRAELDAAVVQNAVVEAGEHTADLYLLIENAEGQLLLPRTPLRLILTSTPRAQVNIAGSAGAFGSGLTVEVIDFGLAATGVTRRAFIQVRANAESTLMIRSENRGVMRHLEFAETGTVVPYSLELDGMPVDLTELWTRRINPPRTLEGVSLPMDFTLGEITGQMSGRYEDLITIDVTPR